MTMRLTKMFGNVGLIALFFVVFETLQANAQFDRRNDYERTRRMKKGNGNLPLDDFIEQRPIEEDPEKLRQLLSNSLAKNKTRAAYKPTIQPPPFPFQREASRANGKPCKFSNDCESGCCQIHRRTNRRRCTPLAKRGQRCETSQVKGGAYFGYCPCVAGYDACGINKKKRRKVATCLA